MALGRFEVDIDPGADWPAAGTGEVLAVKIERSADGVSWAFDIGVTFGDASCWKRKTATIHSGAGGIPDREVWAFAAHERLRFTFHAIQSCAPSVKLFGIPAHPDAVDAPIAVEP